MRRSFFSVVAVVLLCWSVRWVEVRAEEQELQFNVRPGIDDEVQLTVEGVTCSFEYKVKGGSSEEWGMMLSVDGNEAKCMIGRPNPPSYLFFPSVKASLKGSGYRLEEAELVGGGQVVPQGEQWLLKKNKIVSSEQWKGSLDVLSLRATNTEDYHTEL
ncbi:hypothetical protein QOT17_014823 [Balamuthia mandrillaris]